ncbi:tetratricopeptide (TPR) repeat protein [Desulfobaculum xiamenense]|uniref:Tetratricopeptide (TPR) repeat protein n=1 Tax=Desulfobaculum xiamenense TaxID=995050 RepID=A0A846QTP8_9BACT|nr:tetratricopeptide repeat protein [Desulfobaculum xiamenense]NJB68009.1 tetratricopeptide (TPR) repeat protein [Desulfobaculum xiamenense]
MRNSIAALVLLVSSLWACSPQIGDGPLARADGEYARGNYLQAEGLYQAYLQSTPQGDERWRVWNRLLDICLVVNDTPTKAVTILEAMILEFADRPERSAELTWKLAEVHTRMRNWGKAAETWLHLLTEESVPTDRLWEIHHNLGKIYQFQGHYDLARDAMSAAVDNAPDGPARATCLYELAQAFFLLNNNEQARDCLRKLLEAQGVDPELEARSIYMLAEIAVAQGDIPAARDLFRSILETYPNPRAVETQLKLLQ